MSDEDEDTDYLPYIEKVRDPFTGALYVLMSLGALIATAIAVTHIAWFDGENLHQLTSKFFGEERFKGLKVIEYALAFYVAFPVLWITSSWSAQYGPTTRYEWLNFFFKWVLDWWPSFLFMVLAGFALAQMFFFSGKLMAKPYESWMMVGLLIFAVWDVFKHQRKRTKLMKQMFNERFSKLVPVKKNQQVEQKVAATEFIQVLHDKGTFLMKDDGQLEKLEGGKVSLPPLILDAPVMLQTSQGLKKV